MRSKRSERSDSEGEVPGQGGGDVALLPEEAQQEVLGVLRPAVDPGVQQPAGDVLILQHSTVTIATTHHRSNNTATTATSLSPIETPLSPWQPHCHHSNNTVTIATTHHHSNNTATTATSLSPIATPLSS